MMIDAKGPFRVGAFFVVLSALLHLAAPFLSNFAQPAMVLVPAGIVYLACAYGLLRGWRWLAYVVFLLAMIGSVAALTSAWSSAPVPVWIYLAIAVLDWLAVLSLLAALWRSKPVLI